MRIPINLSSEPFRRDRPILLASGAVGLLMVASLILFTGMAFSERSRSAEARTEISGIEKQLATMNAEQNRIGSVLRQPQNAAVLDRTYFVNELLRRKGVSWTRIFADLEQVVPHNVRVMQIRPHLMGDNRLVLEMVVGAQSFEPVVSFLKKLEESPVFGAYTVHASVPPSQTEPLQRYRLSVNYAQKL